MNTDLALYGNKRNVYIAQIELKNIMIPIVGIFLNILSAITGQLGPNYDPLFYDVMIYIFGTIMFTVFLLGDYLILVTCTRMGLQRQS